MKPSCETAYKTPGKGGIEADEKDKTENEQEKIEKRQRV